VLAAVPGTVAGVGIDAVDVARFRAVLRRRPGMAERLFTESERSDASRRGDPAESLAARFAAKEAVLKALGRGVGSVRWREVEVVRATGAGSRAGAPSIRLGPGAARLARERDVGAWHVSMSHTASVAVAVVVAERAGSPGPGLAQPPPDPAS
jgi:holo-[acyl-carrier protein] synthase